MTEVELLRAYGVDPDAIALGTDRELLLIVIVQLLELRARIDRLWPSVDPSPVDEWTLPLIRQREDATGNPEGPTCPVCGSEVSSMADMDALLTRACATGNPEG